MGWRARALPGCCGAILSAPHDLPRREGPARMWEVVLSSRRSVAGSDCDVTACSAEEAELPVFPYGSRFFRFFDLV